MDVNAKYLNIINIFNISPKKLEKEKLIYNELVYTKNESLLSIKYTYNLIEEYLNNEGKKYERGIKYNTKIRNFKYLGKILKNKKLILKKKETNGIKDEDIILKIFISFNKNVRILYEKYSKEKSIKNNKIIICLKNLFNIILNLIGASYILEIINDDSFSYILEIINDDSFELILKIVLDFSLETISKNKTEKIEDLKYMMFFNETIKLIKTVFNYFDEYSQGKIDIIKNILIHINNNFLGSYIKNNINYSNKYFFSKTGYKASLLIDLAYIITKIKSNDIEKIFLNLLTNIYSFDFCYDNCMRPFLKLLEPLFFNLNNKNIGEINDGLRITDFSLNFINALINKENELSKKDSCLLKKGFYLGNETSAIYGDINNLEPDFLIIFGFKLESDDLYDVSLFELYRKESSLIKFYLTKDLSNMYELQIEDEKINSTKVIIQMKKTYIFIFQISFKKKEIKIFYIKDNENKEKNKESDENIHLGRETKLKIKNLKTDNLKICIGCKRINGNFQNNYKGFIGDFLILNMKPIKDKNEKILIDLYTDILKLKNDYFEIENILTNNENSKSEDNYNKSEINSFYSDRDKKIEKLINNKTFRTNYSINIIIVSNYFKLVEHQNEADYINKNYEYYSEKLKKPFSVKFKYVNKNQKIKPEAIHKKAFNINTSLFNRYFHTFERKFSLKEFFKYKIIHYFSLLFEYYYQITCHLIKINNNVDQNILTSTCKEINEKLIKILQFFYINIIQTKLYQSKITQTKIFFYQMIIFILKFSEIGDLSQNTFKIIYDILNTFDLDLKSNTNINEDITKFLLLIRKKLFQILINPRLFKEKNQENYEKLNYVFLSLLTFLKNNEIKNLKNILKKDHLEILLSYIWLLDLPDDLKIFEITRNNYISFLILYLQIAISSQTNEVKNPKVLKEISNNSFEENLRNFYIYQIFKLAVENRRNKYIFYNLSLIMVKSNIIIFLSKSDIEKIKGLFMEEIFYKELRNTDHKKTLYLSYLQLLISYYSSRNSNKDSSTNSNETFHNFLKDNKILLDKDLFYAFISLLRIINNFSKLNNTEINSYENEDLKKFSKHDYISFSDLPMNEIEINYLNELENHIIKNIFLYIIYLLDELTLVKSLLKSREKKINKNNITNHPPNTEDNTEEEFFNIVKKNLDIIYKYSNTKLYEIIFSSKSNVCSNLFLIKWKYGDIKDINYIKSTLKNYYKELYGRLFSPFIYKFLLEISIQNIIQNEDLEENDRKSLFLNFKADMIIYIIETLNNYYLKLSKEMMPYFTFHIVNLSIVINHELNYTINDLFEDQKLYEHLKLYVSLISKGLLFSNYCIEMNDNPELKEKAGKIISEILFDMFLSFPQKFFDKKLFINTFTRGNRKKVTIFFIIDISKEFKKDKGKDKKQKKNIIPELESTKEYNNIFSSYKNDKKNVYRYFAQENKLYQIARTNYTMYFLAKCFTYLRSDMMKEEMKKENQLKEKENALKELIHYLDDDLFSLYTEYKLYYEVMPCGFPLYDETKKFFELNILQNYINDNRKSSSIMKSFDLYKKFFFNDLIVTLKDKYKLEYCYSSKLKIKKNIEIPQTKKEEEKKNTKVKVQDVRSNSSDNNSVNNSLNNKSSQNSSLLVGCPNFKNQNASNLEFSLDITDDMSRTKEEITELYPKEFIHSFEIIKENITILNPRNFFFKNVFSEAFQDFMFINKSFMDIKNIYLMKYRNRSTVIRETKQINYPTRQKNFFNFLEPKMFLRRDFNFFDENFFPISFKYLPESFVNNKLKDFYLYKHQFKYKKEKIKMNFVSELVTNQDIYFGHMYLFEKYLIFVEQDDPRNNDEIELETFINYCISTKVKEGKIIKKNKFIVIYFNEIKEVFKRRTLLITQSIEIFLNSGKAYFFNFFKTKEAKKIYDFFNEKKEEYNFSFSTDENKKKLKSLLDYFHEGNITNYIYLLGLNKYSTRTYSDLSQYPIFPWLVLNKKQLLNRNPSKSEYDEIQIRDMKYPISMQNEEKREYEIIKYKKEFKKGKFNNHFDNHYASSAFIFYYLMRLNPYGQDLIKLQNYQNEDPNRMFITFDGLEDILSFGNDNRELIPDLFCYFDYLINLNCCFLGEIYTGSLNDDFNVNEKFNFSFCIQFIYR